ARPSEAGSSVAFLPGLNAGPQKAVATIGGKVGGGNRTKRPTLEANMTTGTVSKLEARSHDNPDETRKPEKATVEVNNLGDYSIGRFTFQPGWTWESSIKPVAKTEHCEKTHVGYCV